MATQTGSTVIFGFTGTDGIAATGLTGNGIFVEADFEHGHDEEQIRSATGDLVNRTFYNLHKKATLTWIPAKDTLANARTAQTTILALIRTILNITACADKPELIDTNWLVVGVKSTGSNTAASRITLTLENHDGITATPS